MATKKPKQNKPKVLVALTSQRYIFSRTAFLLIKAALDHADYEFDFYMELGCEIASARNRTVHTARERNCTHVLFVDYDMYFPPSAISKLLAEDKDIIGAAYNRRDEDLKSTAVPVGMTAAPHPRELPTEPFKCECLGAGLLLIKTSVFDKFPGPWFMFGYQSDGTLSYGEDTYFCQRAIKEAGFDVWADPTLHVKHIGEQLF